VKTRSLSLSIYSASLLLSLLVHIFFLFAFIPSHIPSEEDILPSKNQAQPQKNQNQDQNIQILSQKEVDQIIKDFEKKKEEKKKLVKKKEEKKEEKKKEEEKLQKEQGQVVEIPRPKKEEVPTDSKFLSEYNQKVEKETKHRNTEVPQQKIVKSDQTLFSSGNDINGTKEGDPSVQSQSPIKSQSENPQKEEGKNFKTANPQDFQNDGALEKPTPEKDSKNKQKSQVLSKDGVFQQEQQKQNQSESEQKIPQGGGKIGGGLMPTNFQSLLPNLGDANQAMKNGTIDHLPEIDISDETSLNSKAFKYAYFFNRVKREVGKNWEIIEEYMRNDPRGNVYGIKDRITVLAITIDLSGIVHHIEVVQESGMPFLDKSAKDAFIKAQPFYEPPKGLAEADGMIRFRFSFHLGLKR
jgi:TonB family protein